MPVYSSSDELKDQLQSLFRRIGEQDPAATQKVAAARLIIRLNCSEPGMQITINGRKIPLQITYGPSSLRPDLDIHLQADILHQILLGELTLTSALGNGLLRVKGPVWKTTVMEDIFHRGQTIYPQLLQEQGRLL